MFKRAMKSNHWMAIGLEKWNDIENMEITPAMIKKMRKYQHAGSDSEDDEQSQSSDQESVGTPEADHDDESAERDAQSGSEEDASEEDLESDGSEGEDHGGFRFCPICPGRKFLTDRDEEAHKKSARHLKREKALANPEPAAKPASAKETVKKEMVKPEPKQAPAANNRKARRAQLADSRSSQ